MDYFAANDIAAFVQVGGTSTEVTTAGLFDATYTTKSIRNDGSLASGAAMFQSPAFINPTTGVATNLTDFWVHFDFYTNNNGGTFSVLEIVNSAGTPVVRFTNTTNVTFRVDYWDGAAWQIGTPTINTGAALVHFDAHIVCGVGGTLDFYANNTLVGSKAGLNAAVTNGAKLNLCGAGAQAFSQVLVSDVSTVGAKVASLVPNSDSATNTAWANDYVNIVKVGYNDATLISDATLGDKESYGATDATLPTAQYFVSSVWFAIRARANSVSPQNIKPLMRIGGVDYAGAYNFGGLSSAAFAPSIAAFANDPSTAAAWAGVTNLNAAELGFQTAA